MGDVIQFVPRANRSRDLAQITPIDIWDFNALIIKCSTDWLWDFCKAGYPDEPTIILSMDGKEPA